MGSFAHELKTPMTSIRGYSELLQAGMIDDPKVRKQALDKIQKEVDHMSQLIGDILMISRLENKDIEVIKHPVHLQPIVDDILESLKDDELTSTKVIGSLITKIEVTKSPRNKDVSVKIHYPKINDMVGGFIDYVNNEK